MASQNVKTATDQNFETEILQGGKPALVDFWATWCGPCRALAPVIDQIADENMGKLNVFKLDIDSNPETPSKFGIRGVPTVILFKNGKIVDQVVGAVPKTRLDELIQKAL